MLFFPLLSNAQTATPPVITAPATAPSVSASSPNAPNTATNVAPTPLKIVDLPLRAPLFSNLEGQISLTRNGFTQIADVKFGAPDSLSVHIRGDKAHLSADEIYVAQSSTQTTFNADTRRVRRWNWSSVREPWRSDALADGGPANIALWGWNPAQIARFYTQKTTQSGDETTVVLIAKPESARFVRDSLRSGGRGDRLFYAVFKRAIYDWPRRVTIKFDKNRAPISLEKRDERNRVLETTNFVFNDAGLPLSAQTRDGNNHLTAQWKYELQAAATPFLPATFNLDSATNGASSAQIVEDAEPRLLKSYAAKTDADSLFNAGVVQGRNAEDFVAAKANLRAAAKAKPTAIAPVAEIFDEALSSRDLINAELALSEFSALPGASETATARRTFLLASQRRDWASVLSALTMLQQANAADLSSRLQRSNLLQLGGDRNGARALLLEILAIASPQNASDSSSNAAQTGDAMNDGVQADAAQILTQNFGFSWRRTEATTLLQTLPRTTQWQLLARSLLQIQMNSAPETTLFANDAAQAALATAQANAGKIADAIASWQIVARRASLGRSTEAHRNLMSLFAQRGDAKSSLFEYSICAARADDDDEISQTRRLLFEAWRAAGKAETLSQALKTRAAAPLIAGNLSASPVEADARLWLAWQENYAAPDAVAFTVRSNASRFSRVAWWQSRLGEQLVGEAAALDKHADDAKTQLTTQALTAVRRAIVLDASQPYYAVQAALIQTLRANDFRTAVVGNASATVDATNAARDALNSLLITRPDDADIALSVAFAGQALSANYPNVVELLQRGLNGGFTNRESADGDRHPTTFAARQALSIALRRQKKFADAAQQMEILLAASRDAGEELGIAVNYLAVLSAADVAASSTRNVPENAIGGAAQLMARLSSESWSLAAADSSARTFASLLQSKDAIWPGAAALMQKSRAPSQQIGAAYFFFTLENALGSMSKNASNSAEMKKYLADLLRTVQKGSSAAETNLAEIAAGPNKVLAPRAASLLGGRALGRGDFETAISRLQSAVADEPDSLDMRFALARAFVSANRVEEARPIRDNMLAAFAPNVSMSLRLATLSAQFGRRDEALELSESALKIANAPYASSDETQRALFFVARGLLQKTAPTKAEIARAKALYAALSSTQWSFQTRLAASLDAENSLRIAGKNAEADAAKTQRAAFAATVNDLRSARSFLSSLDAA